MVKVNRWEVKWTGRCPNLCSGRWEISLDGIFLNKHIPFDVLKNHMNTFGEYWEINLYDEENPDSYFEGLEFEDWIKENVHWIYDMLISEKVCQADMNVTYQDLKDLFSAIQQQDWRRHSCGGCI